MTWTSSRLKYVAAAPMVNGLGEAAREGDAGWPRYIRTTDISSPRTLNPEKRVTLPPALAAQAEVERDDLLLCAAGSLGKVYLHQSEESACYAGYLVRFRPDRSLVDPRFVAYWAESRPFLDQLAVGAVRSTIDNFSASKYQNMTLLVPPLEEQRRIADFLDGQVAVVETAIRLRQRQIALIAARARRSLADLYDFEAPGRRKARLHHLLRQSPSYGVLVPRFTELDGVPFVRVNDLAALQAGRAPATMISREQAYEYRRTIVEPGDVLTSVVGTLGVSAIVPDVARGANVARAVCLLRPAPGVTSWFLHGWLASSQFLASAERATGGGTAQATLNMGDLAKFEVAVPSAGGTGPVGKAVRVVLLETRSATDLLTRGLRLLEERKQALITAAVTGQLDVTTARSAA